MGDFLMPSLGADMDAGTLVEWHVTPGAHVKRGDVVALVETQKGLVEIEIWESGVVDAIVVAPGATVPVGTVLAHVQGEGPVAAKPVVTAPVAAAAPPPSRAPAPAPAPAPTPASGCVLASPAARARARELGVDLATCKGTGPHGAVTRDDVDRAGAPAHAPIAAAPVPPAPRPSAGATQAMRSAIASAMSRSNREIPHYYLAQDIDVSRAARWLETENAKRPATSRILFAALLLRATARALRDVPELNGFFIDGAFRPSADIHLGVAISLRQGGLVAPAIHDADKRSPGELMTALQDLVARARSGSLRSSEMSDPTITVTNLGDQGTDSVLGVIYPPQVALVGFGVVRERPWAENGLLGVRTVVTATLAADHRVSDGHRGGRFLTALARHLAAVEEP
jgi:pyruvate dehydrogenase E2 component (dihydrolipoamide acetyltransferase)